MDFRPMHTFKMDTAVGRALRADKWRVQHALPLLWDIVILNRNAAKAKKLSSPAPPRFFVVALLGMTTH